MKLTLDYLTSTLIGRRAKANHPITCLNPDEIFTITEVKVEVDARGPRLLVRGENTCWWGENTVTLVDI